MRAHSSPLTVRLTIRKFARSAASRMPATSARLKILHQSHVTINSYGIDQATGFLLSRTQPSAREGAILQHVQFVRVNRRLKQVVL